MPTRSRTGEVADFCDADQFQPAKTQEACGFFAVACVDAAAPAGHPCTKTVAQVIAEAETWYAQYNGSNDLSNVAGMTQDQLHQLLKQVGLQYYQLANDLNQIRSWIQAGFPVIINGVEDSYYDIALGDIVPYYWNGAGLDHIITLTGVTSDGNFFVRDSANVTDLNNPHSLRPGPRQYDARKMQLLWATAVVMHGQVAPVVQEGTPVVGIPHGWTDDGKALHNPVNHFVVVAGFRTMVLNWPGGWESWNVPLENEHEADPLEQSNPGMGHGQAQVFRDRRLERQSANGSSLRGWLGQEFQWYKNQLTSQQAADQKSIADLQAQEATNLKTLTSLQAQISSLQEQLQQAQANGTITPDEQGAINTAVAALQTLKTYAKETREK
jgi:hypothetical protein